MSKKRGLFLFGLLSLTVLALPGIGYSVSAIDGFDPNANSEVLSVAVQSDGKILVGRWFTTIGGVTRNYIARLNRDGSLDTNFDPNASNTVRSIVVQADGKILVVGSFGVIGEATRNYIARLNPDGSLDTGFDPNADWYVYLIIA